WNRAEVQVANFLGLAEGRRIAACRPRQAPSSSGRARTPTGHVLRAVDLAAHTPRRRRRHLLREHLVLAPQGLILLRQPIETFFHLAEALEHFLGERRRNRRGGGGRRRRRGLLLPQGDHGPSG